MMSPGSGMMQVGLTGVTASPEEINVLDGVTAGTVTALKALVVDAGSALDALTITTLTVEAAVISTFGNGAVDVSPWVATENGDGVIHKTMLSAGGGGLITITREGDDSGHGNTKLYNFPEGRILILGVTVDLTIDVSGSANIANTGSGNFSLGTTGTVDGTLDGTDVDLCPSTRMTDPFNAGVGAAAGALVASAHFDGTGTAKDAYLSLIFDAGDVTTGDGVATITGTVTITWINLGDY